jgi:hypothetical protein
MRHPSTTVAKADICFGEWFGLERVTKFRIFHGSKHYLNGLLTEFLSSNTSKFEVPPIRKFGEHAKSSRNCHGH